MDNPSLDESLLAGASPTQRLGYIIWTIFKAAFSYLLAFLLAGILVANQTNGDRYYLTLSLYTLELHLRTTLRLPGSQAPLILGDGVACLSFLTRVTMTCLSFSLLFLCASVRSMSLLKCFWVTNRQTRDTTPKYSLIAFHRKLELNWCLIGRFTTRKGLSQVACSNFPYLDCLSLRTSDGWIGNNVSPVMPMYKGHPFSIMVIFYSGVT